AAFAAANHGLGSTLLGRLDGAEARLSDTVRASLTASPSPEILLYAFEGLALVAGSRGDDLRAAALWGVSAGICDATGYVLAPAQRRLHDELAREVRGRLGDSEFENAWNSGRQLSFEQATALALRETRDPGSA